MTARPVRIQPAAERHLLEAYDWYEKQREGLGLEFVAAFEQLIERIAERPEMYPVHRHRMRRALTLRFPYLAFDVLSWMRSWC